MKHAILKPIAVSILLLSPSDVDAQSVPGLGGGVPGIGGGMFGGGKPPALLELQVLQQAQLVSQTEALLKQIMSNPAAGAPSVAADVARLFREFSQMNQSFATIYDDPAAYGSHSGAIEFRNRQRARQLARMEEMKASAEEVDRKVRAASGETDQLVIQNKDAPGSLAAEQVGNRMKAVQIDLQREELKLSQMNLRAAEQQEARRAEDEALAKVRECNFWGPLFSESCDE